MVRQTRTDTSLLAMALVGYEAEKAKIDEAIREIRSQIGQRGPGRPATGATTPPKWRLSAAARARIAAAQRKRWAAIKKAQAESAKPKRKLSAAARKSIGDAARKRWAAVRKAAAKKTKPGAKKTAKAVAKPAEPAT